MSAVALGVCHGSLAHRGWHHCSTVDGVRTLRQSYITPYCMKCRSSHSQAHFVARHRLRALWVYAAGVMQNCLRWSRRHPLALPGRFAPYVQPSVALSGVLALWHMSGALRIVLVSGLRPVILSEPRPPPRGSLRTERLGYTFLTVAALTGCIQNLTPEDLIHLFDKIVAVNKAEEDLRLGFSQIPPIAWRTSRRCS
jgi:hypothetical protein